MGAVAMADNRLRFTTQRLEKLACPPDKDHAYFYDDEIRGLCLYVGDSGVKTFYLYRRVAGRPTRLRLGSWPHELSIDDARKEARKASGDVAKGIDPHKVKLAARAEMTFGELMEKHLDHAKVHNRSWKENEKQYKSYLSHWQNRRITGISRSDVQALHSHIGEKHGKYVANRTLALVHHAFAKTAANCGFTGSNPAHGIDKFREKSRERFLHPDEMPKFLKALEDEPELFRDFFLMALLTGARRANVQSMRWEDISFDRTLWRIPETKSGEPVTVPLVPEAMEILLRRRVNSDSPFVFPSHGKSGHLAEPKKAWKRLLDRAGIADLRLHDLRRTFGSWQAAAGVSLTIIGKSMGHKNQSTTAVYARLSLEPVRAAVTAATSAMMAMGTSQSTQESGNEK